MKKISSSILVDMHSRFLDLPYYFRTAVCDECEFSTASYYRKVNPKKGKKMKETDKDRIIAIAQDILMRLQEALEKHKHDTII